MTKRKWDKYTDWLDGSPRYSFEGRDPESTLNRFTVVIYRERITRDFQRVYRYFGSVYDNAREAEWFDNGEHGYKSVRVIKEAMEACYDEMTSDKESLEFTNRDYSNSETW